MKRFNYRKYIARMLRISLKDLEAKKVIDVYPDTLFRIIVFCEEKSGKKLIDKTNKNMLVPLYDKDVNFGELADFFYK